MLYKKELEGIPLLLHKFGSKKGHPLNWIFAEIVDLPQSGKLLVADMYRREDDALLCRFFTDGKNYHTCLHWPPAESDWTKQNPEGIVKNASEEDETRNLVCGFLDGKTGYRWGNSLSEIGSFVYQIGRDRRIRQWEQRQKRMELHFSMYPAYPENLGEYCEEKIFDHSYIFISKVSGKGNRTGRCGHCGKRFRVPRKVRSGQQAVCPKCGVQAVYRGIWHKGKLLDKAQLCIAHKVDGQLLLRWTQVWREFSGPDYKREYSFSDFAYNLYLKTKDGNKLYFYKIVPKPYFGDDWYIGRIGEKCYDKAYMYTDNLDNVFGTRFYNVDLKAGLEGRKIKISFTRLLDNLRNCPVAEYLFKMSMPALAADIDGLDVQETTNRPDFSSVLGVSAQLKPLYVAANINLQEHRLIRSYGKFVTLEVFTAYRSLNIPGYSLQDVKELLKTMSFHKFVNYFGKQKALNKSRSADKLLSTYRDYIDMATKLGVDLSHKAARYPKDCAEAHDRILPLFNQVKYEIEDGTFAEAVKPLYAAMPVHAFEENGLCIVFPQKRSDLVSEGQSLCHCVGGDGYYRKHIAGVSMIFFIRKVEHPDRPFFTMELNMETFRIVQIHGLGNKEAPKEVREFAKAFAKKLASRPAKNDRKMEVSA